MNEEKFYCSVCGKEISRKQYEDQEGMWEECFYEYYQQIDDWEIEEVG